MTAMGGKRTLAVSGRGLSFDMQLAYEIHIAGQDHWHVGD